MLIRIVIGIVGLGVVVFLHELGHFIAARLCGIQVEAFSIGWGPPILARSFGSVEYRIGVLPIGGYCKMRGEAAFKEALLNPETEIPNEPGSFFGTSPIKRCFVSVAGPLANLLFSFILFSGIWGFGFEVHTLDNRIILASDIEPGKQYPADNAGLHSGDRIIAIAGKATHNYSDIQQAIAPFPNRNLNLTVDRDGEILTVKAIPQLDTESGAGKLGIYFWTEPIIEQVKPGSSAAIAGLETGDIILKVNDRNLLHTATLTSVLKDRPNVLSLILSRQGQTVNAKMVVAYDDDGNVDLGIDFKTVRYRTPRLTPIEAIRKGLEEVTNTLFISMHSLSLLFKGIDLTKAVSGPVRITYMFGDVAAQGFSESFGTGVNAVLNFLAFLSIALAFMNLLPIPALDGGLIILFLIEAIRKKPLKTRTVYYFQLVGSIAIFGLLLFSLFGDILFLLGR